MSLTSALRLLFKVKFSLNWFGGGAFSSSLNRNVLKLCVVYNNYNNTYATDAMDRRSGVKIVSL